jgi:hypothetical protein
MILARRHHLIPTVLLVVAGFVTTGCNDGGDELPRERVSGTVTLGGRPLTDGTIAFMPTDPGAPGTGSLASIVDGAYAISRDKGLVAGPYRVTISRTVEGAKPANAQPGDGDAPVIKELIPAKYNSKTKLQADVTKGGENLFNFTLDEK